MTIKMLLASSALAGSAVLALPSAATAQVNVPATGIASASPADAIFGAKAWAAANQMMTTTYKDQIAQIQSKGQQRQALLTQLDKNGDKQVDDAELQAAQAANNPVLGQIAQLEREIQPLQEQLAVAQAYVLDTIAQRYSTALQTVITARKISVVFARDAFVYSPPSTDITQPVVAEIDRVLPSVNPTPPPNWQVTQQGAQLLDQWQQLQQAMQQQRAAQAAAAPATGAPRPATPAAGAAAAPRPATPAAGPPARPATQPPASR